MRPVVKICGICSREAAKDAIRAGADYVGLIFSKSSLRCVSLSEAAKIAHVVRGRCKLVGVFQDEEAEFINRITELLTLDMVQLHGAEEPDLCKQVLAPIIKAITIEVPESQGDTELDLLPIKSQIIVEARRVEGYVEYLLFDRPKSETGSRGFELILQAMTEIEIGFRYFLAGGLNSGNLLQVLERLQPFGIDVASGVEISPCIKDYRKMQILCEMVRGRSQPAVDQSSVIRGTQA